MALSSQAVITSKLQLWRGLGNGAGNPERTVQDEQYPQSTPAQRNGNETAVLELIDETVATFAGQTALCMKDRLGWTELTFGELSQRAQTLASYLIENGMATGDRVAILSESRPEFAIAFFGALRAGAIIVPLDPKLGRAELTSILTDCAPRILLVSSQLRDAARSMPSAVPSLHSLLLLEDGHGEADIPSLDQLVPSRLLPSRSRPTDETALLIYTSGTTGSPKGVMISYDNLLFQATRLGDVIHVVPGDCLLSVLPLNHLLELTGGFLSILIRGGTICYAQSLYPHELAEIMRERRTSIMIGVPLLYRLLKESIERQIAAGSRMRRLWFRAASWAASFLRHRQVRRLLFSPLHRRFGSRLRVLVSGGAPLDRPVALFFERIGLPILEGYGLTETSPVVTVNTLEESRLGSVGRPLDGVELEIAPAEPGQTEGEILTRGPHVMQGYYRRPDLTREVIDENGWFHTGDLGRLDQDGFLYITGRIKNLIVMGGGKKVQSEEVEAVLAQSTRFKEVCVLGRISRGRFREGTEEVCAVVVPGEELATRWQEAPEEVRAEVQAEVARLVGNLAPFKRPSKIIVHPSELPKTPSRKVKRGLVHEWLDRREQSIGRAEG